MKRLKSQNSVIFYLVLGLSLVLFLSWILPWGIPETDVEASTEVEALDNRIAIFVDTNTYNQLSSEINRLKQDIVQELDVQVEIYHDSYELNLEPDPQREQLREKLVYLYSSENLIGAILIGNVPMAWWDSEETLTGITGEYVSDYYYMDLDSNYPDDDNNGYIEWPLNYHLDPKAKPEIWVGRIKPPVGGEEGMSLLKSYLDRNHRYRTGQIDIPQKILWFHASALADEQDQFEDIDELRSWYYEGARNSINWSLGPWNFGQEVDVIFDENSYETDRLEEATNEYLEKLGSEAYEFVVYTGHGTPTYQWLNISPSILKDIAPKAFFGVFDACSLGNYSVENYIGGWYLFGGNGLAMIMRTFPSLASVPTNDDFWQIVKNGLIYKKTFGDAFKYFVGQGTSPSPAHSLLGDPTLRLRYSDIITIRDHLGEFRRKDYKGISRTEDREIVKNFYRHFKDNFDFIGIYTASREVGLGVYQVPIKNEIQGIGLPLFDDTNRWGSGGRLKGVQRLGVYNPRYGPSYEELDVPWREFMLGSPTVENTELSLILHEIGHQWAAFIGNDVGSGKALELTRDSNIHWADELYLGDTMNRSSGGGLMGRNCVYLKEKQNLEGVFDMGVCQRNKFSSITQYLMGLIPPEQASRMKLMEWQEESDGWGVKKKVSIDDVIGIEGPRIPFSQNSQKNFRMAIILLTDEEGVIEEELQRLNEMIQRIPGAWAYSTDYKSTLDISINPLKDVILDFIPPSPPTDITVTDPGVGGTLDIGWTNPTDADFAYVNIYRATDAELSNIQRIYSQVTGNSIRDSNLLNGTEYFYLIRSVDTSKNESTNRDTHSGIPTSGSE